MPRRNKVIPNVHFHKDWQRYVKTWFGQPMKKLKRRNKREEKAARVFPRPVSGLLRPVVQCQTVKYNARARLGRGFTVDELRAAGVNLHEARTIGISVDRRRKNRSQESLAANVARLKEYQSKLILFPRHPEKPKAKDSSAEETSKATQHKGRVLLPIKRSVPVEVESMKVSELPKGSVYKRLRTARRNARLVGKRAQRAKKRAEAAALAEQKNQ
jgi:large subunit ribosomal protein L13e